MKLLGIGGAHIDRRGQVTGDYVPAASNPGTMREDIGGGTLNALRSAVQRGSDCSLISVRGGDAAGEAVARAVMQAGIADLSVTFLDRATPSYTALIDREGELIAGFADMGLYDLAFPKQMRRSMVREAVATSQAVLTDANVPEPGISKLAALTQGRPFFAIGVSPAKVVRLAGVVQQLTCLFTNRREAQALARHLDAGTPDAGTGISGAVDTLRRSGLRAAIITAGGDAITGFDDQGLFHLTPPSPRKVMDVTGAGDALTGATIAALLDGQPLRRALRDGVAASILAIESQTAVPELDSRTFGAVLALVPEVQAVA